METSLTSKAIVAKDLSVVVEPPVPEEVCCSSCCPCCCSPPEIVPKQFGNWVGSNSNAPSLEHFIELAFEGAFIHGFDVWGVDAKMGLQIYIPMSTAVEEVLKIMGECLAVGVPEDHAERHRRALL
jgi:hypothetical protein